MKVVLTQTIKSYDGKEVVDENKKPVELRTLLVTALNNFLPDEKPTQDHKNKAFGLSLRLYAGDEVDFNLDDRAFIKERVQKIYDSPLYCGRVSEILEGEDN